jgi:hypothetical protein
MPAEEKKPEEKKPEEEKPYQSRHAKPATDNDTEELPKIQPWER